MGLLLSGTVALEAHLSGAPTVFLDLEGLYSNELYRYGREKLVFDDLDALFAAIGKFRQNAESIPGFGDLSSWAKDRDLYKDGNAAFRIGQYIGWLHEAFGQSKSRQETLTYANRKYREQWGTRSIEDLYAPGHSD